MSIIYSWSTTAIVSGCVSLTFLATVLGYFIGLRFREEDSDRVHGVSTALKGSILGLVALILGFTYSMTTSRYDERQHIVLNEANAAGTCYLRAGLLGESARNGI